MNENATINPELENVAEKLREARQKSRYTPDIILDFADYMAEICEKTFRYNRTFIPETMVLLIDDAKKSIESGLLVLDQETIIQVPDRLNGKAEEINEHILCLMLVMEAIASKEFSTKFKKLFMLKFSK